MNLVYEKRLDGAIDVSQFVDCEGVEVRTKMGAVVTKGKVESVVPFGLIVREESGDTRFFKEDLYIFSATDRASDVPDNEILSGNEGIEEYVIVQSTQDLSGMSVDERVRAKLNQFLEAESSASGKQKETGAQAIDDKEIDDIGKPEKGDKKALGNDDEKKSGDDKGKKSDDKKNGKKDDKKDGKDKEPIAKIDSSVDVEKLPEDIKGAITSAKDMDDQQLNNVLGEISEAAMKGLKRSGVLETSIYRVVQDIQDASYKILTGKEPPKE